MAGSSNAELQEAYIVEVTPGTTPATPGFTKTSFDTLSMTADPRLSESFPRASGGQRYAIGRNGIGCVGNASGKLIYGEYDDFFASLFQDTWTADVLVNGTGQVAMTIEQAAAEGAGGSLGYTRFRGVEAVSGRIAITAGQDINVSLDLIGSGSDNSDSAIIVGATYADPTETDIIGSGADVGTITMTGFTLDCMESCTVDFGVVDKTEQPRISSNDACGINRGIMRPIITGRFYVEANFRSIYDAARSGTNFALTIPLGQVSTKKYSLYFPSCEFVSNPLETGETGPVFQTFRILPLYHAATGGTVQLTRAIV